MANFSKAVATDKQDIIDFINYVFSEAYAPHDFKKKLPKVYADDAKEDGVIHYLAKQDGRIKAVVGERRITVNVDGAQLNYGLIGSVSVHPYSRGLGLMKELMGKAISEAQKDGVDMLLLSGQRQRYGYFGFQWAGTSLKYTINATNIKHSLGDIDCSEIDFRHINLATEQEINTISVLYESRPVYTVRNRDEYINIMSSWQSDTLLIYDGGRLCGYIFGPLREIVLKDEEILGRVIKAYFEANDVTELGITVHPFQKQRSEILSGICEKREIVPSVLVKVLCWERVLSAFLGLKSKISPLLDDEMVIQIGHVVLRIAVESGVPSVQKSEGAKPQLCLGENEALELFFGLDSLLISKDALKNWVPLPFTIDPPDMF